MPTSILRTSRALFSIGEAYALGALPPVAMNAQESSHLDQALLGWGSIHGSRVARKTGIEALII